MKSAWYLIRMGFGFLLFCFPAPVWAVDLTDLVSGDYLRMLGDVKTIRSVGRVEIGGMAGSVEMLFKVPDKLYAVYDLGVIKLRQGFDGRTAWVIDQNGQQSEVVGKEKEMIINAAYQAGFSYLFKDRMQGDVAYYKDTIVDSQKYYIFSALPAGGDTLGLFVNAVSGRVEIVRARLDELDIYDFYSDFRPVDGLEMPFACKTNSAVPQFNALTEFTEIEINVPMDDDIFAMAVSDKKDYVIAGGLDSAVVPFQYLNGHIILKGAVDGNEEADFILDSGAGANVIDKTYAKKIGLNFEAGLPAKGVAGYETVGIGRLDSLRVGDIVLYEQAVAVVDLAGIGVRTEGILGGILGYDLLSRFPCKIDYSGERLVLYRPEKFSPPDSELAVNFETFMKVPYIEAEYDGIKADFIIDLGNPFGLILHDSFVSKYNLDSTFADIKEIKEQLGGVGGSSRVYAAVGGLLKIGKVEIKKPPLMVTDSKEGFAGSVEFGGNIGNLMLQEFTIILDYNNKRLYFLPSGR
jgi:hypothetical protein